MRNKIILSFVLLFAIFATLLTFGDSKTLDVVAREAINSFSTLTSNYTGVIVTDSAGNSSMLSPSGLERFFWGEKVGVEFAVAPFLKAGLDVSKLPPNFALEGDKLVIAIENKAQRRENSSSSFADVVHGNRETIGYHSSLGHFGIALKVSHFEWAKDLFSNDKDIVFMLNPAILAPAGLDPKKLEGWTLASVELMDGNVKYNADRLLKFYDVK